MLTINANESKVVQNLSFTCQMYMKVHQEATHSAALSRKTNFNFKLSETEKYKNVLKK